MAKRKVGNQIANLIPNHKKLGIALISLHVGGMPHTFGKFSMRATMLFLNFTSIRGLHTKLWASKVAGVPILGILGQNDIWMLASWPSIDNTIRGKVVASPKSRSWWILWVHLCPWFVRASKMLQLCYHNPTFGRVWGWHSHFRNGVLGVLWDSRNFRIRL